MQNLKEDIEIYNKGQKYKMIYADKDGKDNEYVITPEEDMTKPKMIMKCKDDNDNFIKLKEIKKLEEGVNKMNNFKKYLDSWIEENVDDISMMEELDGTEAKTIINDYIQETGEIELGDPVIEDYKEEAEKALENALKIARESKIIESVDNSIKTLADAINQGKTFDVIDMTTDEMVYFEYDPASADPFDQCLREMADHIRVVDHNEDYSIIEADIFTYVENHINAFDQVFTLEGPTDAVKAEFAVEHVISGLFSGYTSENTYSELLDALKKDNTTIKEEDHQLYYDDIQEMNSEERHALWMKDHEIDYDNEDEFWDWVEEEYPVKELNESKLTEGKIDYLKEIQNMVETAQYNMGLDEFFKFLDELKAYVDMKHYDNEPTEDKEEESSGLKNRSVKSWMLEVHPEEADFIANIPEDKTFDQVWQEMNKGIDIYEILDFADSVTRECIFDGIAEAFNIDPEDVYQVWIKQ